MSFQEFYHPVIKGANKKRFDGALKRYESVEDSRAYSINKTERADFILGIVKRRDNEGGNASESADEMSQKELIARIQELVKELKAKDVELDKIHKLFKQSSKKLEDMNDVAKESRKIESQLKDSKEQLEKLHEEKKEKELTIHSIKQELENVKTNSVVNFKDEGKWNELKKRSDMLDQVTQERDALKSQVCKISGVSDVLHKLKRRADQADMLEQEIMQMKRKLERCGDGVSNDEKPKKQLDSACNQCHKNATDLARSQSILDAEVKKNCGTEAERNFLREKCRTLEVMDAELILYKLKYEESEARLMELKEAMARSEITANQLCELKQKLACAECQLNESELHAQELINIVERQEMELKERDVYIECINRRIQSDYDGGNNKKALGCSASVTFAQPEPECIPPGKVQSIVQKMSSSKRKSHCKCGIDSCYCASLSSKLKVEPSSVSIDSFYVPCDTTHKCLLPSENSSKSEIGPCQKVDLMTEASRYNDEISCDEIRQLRCQNAALDEELIRYKKEVAELSQMMEDVDKEREANCRFENELKCVYDAEVEKMHATICNQGDEVCLLNQQLQEEHEKSKRLETELNECKDKLQALQCFEKRCHELNGELKCIQNDDVQRSNQIENLQSDCEKYCDENSKLNKRIRELEVELEEQQKYTKSLAAQLCNRQKIQSESLKPCNRPQTENETQNREFLKKCIKQLKNNYSVLQVEKLDMIRNYEEKLKTLECENESLLCRGAADKTCKCNWSSSNDCGDALLRKAAKFGLCSLQPDELTDLHSRVRVSMLQAKQSQHVDFDLVPVDYYTKMADEIRVKYKLSDSLMPGMDVEPVPVRDFDDFSSKTMPSILQCGQRSSKKPRKPRARSSEGDKTPKCVTISRPNRKK